MRRRLRQGQPCRSTGAACNYGIPARGAGWLQAIAVSALLSAVPGPALAQAVGASADGASAKATSVMSRPRPEFDPLCVPLDRGGGGSEGGFLACPRVHVTTGYDDNVFRAEDGEAEADVFTEVSPQLTVNSNWDNHGLNFVVGSSMTRHAEHRNNDAEDFHVSTTGRLDIREELYASGKLAFARRHEDASDPNRIDPEAGVNEFHLATESLGVDYRPADLSFALDVAARQFDFVDSDDRDRSEYETVLRAGYGLGQEFQVFVEPAFRLWRYDRKRDSRGFERDSQGYQVRTGVLYDVAGLTYLEASVGYFRQEFEDPGFATASGPLAEIDMTWNATELATVNLNVNRTITPTTLADTSSIVRTSSSIGLNYEVGYNLLFNSLVQYRRDDFEGTPREDDLISGSVGLIYLMNEYFSFNGRYIHRTRSSTSANADFSANTYLLTLRAQL